MKTGKLASALLGTSFVLCGFSRLATAQSLDSLKGLTGKSSSLSSLSSGSTGNAAGIIEYCIKNNYLGGNDASSVKDKLIGKLGGEDKAKEDSGFMAGASGLLQGSNGNSTNLTEGGTSGALGNLKAKATEKACDAVLKQGKSML